MRASGLYTEEALAEVEASAGRMRGLPSVAGGEGSTGDGITMSEGPAFPATADTHGVTGVGDVAGAAAWAATVSSIRQQTKALADGDMSLDNIPPADRAKFEGYVEFYRYTGQTPTFDAAQNRELLDAEYERRKSVTRQFIDAQKIAAGDSSEPSLYTQETYERLLDEYERRKSVTRQFIDAQKIAAGDSSEPSLYTQETYERLLDEYERSYGQMDGDMAAPPRAPIVAGPDVAAVEPEPVPESAGSYGGDLSAPGRAPVAATADLEHVRPTDVEDRVAAIENRARVHNEGVWADWQNRQWENREAASYAYDTGEIAEQQAGERALEKLGAITADNFYETLNEIKSSGIQEVQISGEWVRIDDQWPGAADAPENPYERDPANLQRVNEVDAFKERLEVASSDIREGVASGTITYGAKDTPEVVVVERPNLQGVQHTEGHHGADDAVSSARANERLIAEFDRKMDEAERSGKIVVVVDPPTAGETLTNVAEVVIPGLGLFMLTKEVGKDNFITPSEANSVAAELALTAFDFIPAPINAATKAGIKVTRIAAPVKMGGGFHFSETSPLPAVRRFEGGPYDRAVLEAADDAAQQLLETGSAQVVVGGRTYTFRQSELDRAIREANPDAPGFSTSAAPDVEKFAAGGEIPELRFPDARAGAEQIEEVGGTLPVGVRERLDLPTSRGAGAPKPESEQFQFRTPGAEGVQKFTDRSAFGQQGSSGGMAIYETSYDDVVRPGAASEPLGTNYFHGRGSRSWRSFRGEHPARAQDQCVWGDLPKEHLPGGRTEGAILHAKA